MLKEKFKCLNGLVLDRRISMVLLRCLEGFVPTKHCTNDTVTGGMFSHIH